MRKTSRTRRERTQIFIRLENYLCDAINAAKIARNSAIYQHYHLQRLLYGLNFPDSEEARLHRIEIEDLIARFEAEQTESQSSVTTTDKSV